MTVEEQIEKMYASSLDSQKAQLETDYAKANEELAQQQKKVQQQTKANLTRTAVESQKAAASNAELHNAYGLSSGAMAQARLAQENQLQADLTALRAVQQQTDADAERQRTLLSQEYASAIRQAQAENDLAKAQALYERAALEEERLHQKQLAAEQTRAAQIAADAASQQSALEQQLAAAKFVAQETGDYSMYGALLGWSSDYIDKLNGGQAPAKTADGVMDQMDEAQAAIPEDVSVKWQTDNTREFIRSMPSAKAHGGGKAYKDYIEGELDKWLTAGRITDDDVVTLMYYYGIAEPKTDNT